MIRKILGFGPGVFIPMCINFLLTILYADLLNPAEYGILNIYLNTIQIIYAVTLSVFQTGSLRFYSIQDTYNDESEFYTSYILGNIFATLLLIPIGLCINMFFKYNWIIIILSIGCNGLFQFICNMYRLKEESGHYNVIRSVTSILSVVVLLVFSRIVKPLSYTYPILSVYVPYGIVTFFSIIINKHKFSLNKFSIKLLKKSTVYAIPLIGVSVLGYIVSSSDQYIILYYLGDKAVGNYALGYRLVDALIVNMITMILLVMTPELNMQYEKQGELSSVTTLRKMINLAIWIMIPISVAVIIYADYIINFMFPKYDNAAHIMQLVVFASIFHGLSMFTCKGLELVKKPKYIFYSLLFASVINCFYNIFFIPIYGVDAAGYSSILAYVCYNIFLLIITRKYYKISFDLDYFFKVLVATSITSSCAYMMMHFITIKNLMQFTVQGLICLLIYMICSYLLGLLKIL